MALAPILTNPKVRLGVDVFSLRSPEWTPFECLDYCANLKVQVVHFSEVRFLGSLEESHLRRVRTHAEGLGLELEIGMRSICPSSKMFDATQGTGEEQLGRMIQAARTVGSPIVRAVLGGMADRTGPVPMESHIENTVRVLRAVRTRASDNGIKIAIENHAGDMQARELRTLIEAAGKDLVGACMDSGNPLWSLEDPHLTVEILAPYVLTTHMRDGVVWRVPEGVAVQWVRLGEGTVGFAEYARRVLELCPGRPFTLETIVGPPRVFPVFTQQFWDGYRRTPAWEFARFLALADHGSPRATWQPAPKGAAAQSARADLEASLRYARELLSL
jgi:3-oxoisoapionate decarboxylase